MRRLFSTLIVVLAGSLLVPATAARASTPIPASGSFSVVPSPTVRVNLPDNHAFFQSDNIVTYTGTLSGTALCHTSGVVDLATGLGAGTCHGSFTGVAGPVSGTFRIDVAFTITGASSTGRFTLTSSQGSVGQFSFVQNLDCAHKAGCLAGTYTGQITLGS